VIPAAVLCDLDGTLVDGETAWAQAHQNVAHALGGHLYPVTLAALAGVDLDTSVATLLDRTGCGGDLEMGEWVRARLLDEVAAVYTAGVVWLPGARHALRRIRAVGLPTALVTNTSRRLVELVLEHIGRDYFDAVVCGDEVPAGKPAPDPYLRAAELLDVDPAKCVALEDSPAGIRSALRAGAAVLTVSPRRYLTGFTLADIARRST